MNSVDIIETNPVSAIKVFKLIQEKVSEINIYPLTPDNIVVQQDAYSRLAAPDDEESYEVFAVIEQARRETDSDLRFMVQLTGTMCILSVEGFGDFYLAYSDMGSTDAEVARQITSTLIMLANGQLSCLHTVRNGRLCAVELIYRHSSSAPPATISLEGTYPRYISSDNPDDYEAHVLRNRFDIDPVGMPKKYFLRANHIDGTPVKLPRTFIGNTLNPLTRTEYKAVMDAVSLAVLGAADDTDLNQKVTSSWVFWLLMIILIVPAVIFLPASVSFLAPVIGLGALFAASFVTGLYFVRIERLRKLQPDHKLLKIDRALQLRDMLPAVHSLALAIIIVSSMFPIYAGKADHQLTTLFGLASSVSVLVLLPLLLLAAAILFNITGGRTHRILAGILGILGISGLLFINFALTYTGDNVVTPEPQTSIAIFSYLAGLALSTMTIVAAVKRSKTTASIN